VERAFYSAGRANVPQAVADFHDVDQAGVIVGKTSEKVPDRQLTKLLKLCVF
jgi:hypothetical protein